MTAAWGGICCSDPPSIAISLRKATYTYGNLMARRAFTVNVPAESQVQAADYFGVVSGRDTDKFAATGLTPTRSEHVDAPYIEEFPWCWSAASSMFSSWGCTRSSSAAFSMSRPTGDPRGRRFSGNRQGAADHLFAWKSSLLRLRDGCWAKRSPWGRRSEFRAIRIHCLN